MVNGGAEDTIEVGEGIFLGVYVYFIILSYWILFYLDLFWIQLLKVLFWEICLFLDLWIYMKDFVLFFEGYLW